MGTFFRYVFCASVLVVISAAILPGRGVAADGFATAFREASSSAFGSGDPARVQELVNRLAAVIAAFPDDPDVYQAELAVAKLLGGSETGESLQQASDLFSVMLRRYSVVDEVPIEIAGPLIEFHIGACAGSRIQDLGLCKRVAKGLHARGRRSDNWALRLQAADWMSRAEIASGNNKVALAFAVDEMSAARTWLSAPAVDRTTLNGNRDLASISQLMQSLDVDAANALSNCGPAEGLQIAMRRPPFLFEDSFLEKVITRMTTEVEQNTLSVNKTSHRTRTILVVLNVMLAVVVFALYIFRRRFSRSRGTLVAILLSLTSVVSSQRSDAWGFASQALGDDVPADSSGVVVAQHVVKVIGPTAPRSKAEELKANAGVADVSVDIKLGMSSRPSVVELGQLDNFQRRTIEWRLHNDANLVIHLLDVRTDCTCVSALTRTGVISPGKSLTGRLTYEHTTMGHARHTVQFMTDAGTCQLEIASVLGRGVIVEPALEVLGDDGGFSIVTSTSQLTNGLKNPSIALAQVIWDKSILDQKTPRTTERTQSFSSGGMVEYRSVKTTMQFIPVESCNIGWHDVPLRLIFREAVSGATVLEKVVHSSVHVTHGFETTPSAIVTGLIELPYGRLPTTRTCRIRAPEGYHFRSADLQKKVLGVTVGASAGEDRTTDIAVTFDEHVVSNRPVDATLVVAFLNRDREKVRTVEVPIKGFVLDRRHARGSSR